MIDLTVITDFERGFSAVVDALEQLKKLEPPAESEGAMGIAKWFRDFHQTLLAMPTIPDAPHLTRFAEELEVALADVAGAGEEARVPEPYPKDDGMLVETPTLFRVTVTYSGTGVSGSEALDCTYKYYVKDVAGHWVGGQQPGVGNGFSPERPRYGNCEYDKPADDSPGLAYWGEGHVLHLYEALEEIPTTPTFTGVVAGSSVTPITELDVTKDGANVIAVLYKRTAHKILEEGGSDPGWLTAGA